MEKNNDSTSVVVTIIGDNNTVVFDGKTNSIKRISKKKKSFKTRLKALGKLIRSIFVNISVLLFEIFAKLMG
ncbi:MAG: hypothetical protein K2M44_06625 [Clostridia bacterium]|nr:hypothetical protein [Clostridia bacterium]